MPRDALDHYEARLTRVLCLIAERIDDPPSLADLASAAALSPYHFHRVWRAIVGEPIMETIRRLRLELAARKLAGTAIPITQIALETGFSSSQSFARAFRKATGRTPTEAREPTVDSPIHPRPPIDSALSVEIVALTPFTIVAKRRTGPCQIRDLGPTFGAVWSWATSHGYVDRIRGIYGVPLDEPVQYDAGFDFGPDVTAPDGMRLLDLGGGEAARARVHGSYDGIEMAYDALYGHWLPPSGYEPADAPLIHRFYNDPDTTPEADLVTDVLLPICLPNHARCASTRDIGRADRR